MAARMGQGAAGASSCSAHRNRGTLSLGAPGISTKGIGTHDMGTLGIGATNLGSLSISRPGTDAPGMPPMPVHSTILHAPRLPGRHEKTHFLPLPKTAHPHATNPAGQVVETGKGMTFTLGNDARRHGWPDAAQGLQLLGRGAVGVDGGGDIRNVSGHHDGGWRPIRG